MAVARRKSANGVEKRERMEVSCLMAVMSWVTEPANWVGETPRQAEPAKSVAAVRGVQSARKKRQQKENARVERYLTGETAIWNKWRVTTQRWVPYL